RHSVATLADYWVRLDNMFANLFTFCPLFLNSSESNSDDMRMLLEKQPKLFCEMFTSLADEGSTPERFINVGAHPQMKRIVSDLESERPFDSFTFTGSRVVRCAHQWV